jgi:hypothetical protein
VSRLRRCVCRPFRAQVFCRTFGAVRWGRLPPFQGSSVLSHLRRCAVGPSAALSELKCSVAPSALFVGVVCRPFRAQVSVAPSALCVAVVCRPFRAQVFCRTFGAVRWGRLPPFQGSSVLSHLQRCAVGPSVALSDPTVFCPAFGPSASGLVALPVALDNPSI